ncbi:MAG: T9SS type A sorting domain-containing protein [Bacteroidales bacterium]|nr:T9SS type A sorting domain-containing protein [Bacteroidales bacterium]MCF8455386.1 T9SS type A sorting domain-containing protein [Bacteroidales bacterium]
MDVSHFDKGLYFLKINSGKESIMERLVIE